MSNFESVKDKIRESIAVKELLLDDKENVALIQEIAETIIVSLKNGGKFFVAGNGGSFADSIHIVGEFVSRFMFDRDPLPAIALGSNNTILTAIGNDYGYNDVFSREFRCLAKPEDVLLCISTSGNSPNIIQLAKTAKEMNIKTYALTGKSGGMLNELAKCVKVPSDITARIQESHITIGHIICELVEVNMFK
jgi:D-sedoheptulose 7-phosphate isomerase